MPKWIRSIWNSGAFWRHIHSFILWFPVGLGSLYGAIFGLATQADNPDAKAFVDGQVTMWRDAVSASWVLVVCAVIIAVWLCAFFWSGRMADELNKPDLATLAELVRPFLQSPDYPEPNLDGEPVVRHLETRDVVTGPPEIAPAELTQTIRPPLLVNEQTFFSPTVTQTPPEFPPGLYVGMIIIAAGTLSEEHSLEIAIRAYNGTDMALRLAEIGGEIEAGETTTHPKKLPLAEWVREHTPDAIPPHEEFSVVLRQPVPEATAKEFLEVIEKGSYVSFDLRAFNIEIAVADNANRRARLPLWDGAAMMRRDDVFTARIIMSAATMTASTRPVPSLKAVLTRADGSTEVRDA